jgi:hypothetical protein
VVKNSLAPRWDEAFEFSLPSAVCATGDARLEAKLLDWDAIGANEPMGTITLPLERILSGAFAGSAGSAKPADDGEEENTLKQPGGLISTGDVDVGSCEEEAQDPAVATLAAQQLAEDGQPAETFGEGVWLPLRPGVVDGGGVGAAQPQPPCRPRNELRFSHFRANGLRVMDKALFGSGSSDPFVKVQLGTDSKKCESAKTSIQKKTLRPDWKGETLALEVDEAADGATEVEVALYDWDRLGSNDFMGRTVTTLRELLAEAEAQPQDDDDSDVDGFALESCSDDGSDDGEAGDDRGTAAECGRRRKCILLGGAADADAARGAGSHAEELSRAAREGRSRGELSFRVQVRAGGGGALHLMIFHDENRGGD